MSGIVPGLLIIPGLLIDQILLAPFKSAQEAQISMSLSSLKYISDYGLDSNGNMKIVQINSSYYDATSSSIKDTSLNIPVISLINMPCLSVKNVSVDFNISIQSQKITSGAFTPSVLLSSSFLTPSTTANGSINATGNLSSSKTNTNESQYKIHIEAVNEKPLGLLMIFDFINTNRNIIKPATGSANVSLKNIFG